jgi:hypothetical protein
MAIATDDVYVGKHRRPGIRSLSMRAMFGTARHLRLN